MGRFIPSGRTINAVTLAQKGELTHLWLRHSPNIIGAQAVRAKETILCPPRSTDGACPRLLMVERLTNAAGARQSRRGTRLRVDLYRPGPLKNRQRQPWATPAGDELFACGCAEAHASACVARKTRLRCLGVDEFVNAVEKT